MRRPATKQARAANERHLQAQRRAEIDRAVGDYARRHAGTSLDLDEPLERAGSRELFVRDER